MCGVKGLSICLFRATKAAVNLTFPVWFMMQRLSQFDIIMPNTSGVFYAGEPVFGQVVLQLKESMKIMRGNGNTFF